MKIGLALGGGGARGLAHIAAIEALDELGIKPSIISGTSIGALIGAAYASGLSGEAIRDYCDILLARRSAVFRHVYSRWHGRIWDYFNPRTPSLFNAERITKLILPPGLPETFEELEIPLMTVAADFYTQCEYVSSTGPLLPAVAASAALPALLTPVKLDGRVLIDGGFVNPLPFDLLCNHADFIIAVDVTGEVSESKRGVPGTVEAVIGAQLVALRTIVREKLKTSNADLLLRPDVGRYRVMDFLQKNEILAAAAPMKEEIKRALHEASRQ